MLVFRGEISENCRRYIIRTERKNARIGAAIAAGIFCVPITILAILYHWAFTLAYIVLILLIILAGILPKQDNYALIIPEEVIINNDVLESKSKKFHFTRMKNQVKKVVDIGEWYHIYFYAGYKCPRFICQKDLMQQGTIEDFEQIFQDKIVKLVLPPK